VHKLKQVGLQSKTYKAQGALTAASTTNRQTQIETVSKTFKKEIKSTLQSDHLNLVNELKSMMITGSEFQAFMTRSLGVMSVFI